MPFDFPSLRTPRIAAWTLWIVLAFLCHSASAAPPPPDIPAAPDAPPDATAPTTRLSLPVAGLWVELPTPANTRWSVRGTWRYHKREGTTRADVLARRDASGKVDLTLRVDFATLHDPRCPMEQPFPIELAGHAWVHEPRPGGMAFLCFAPKRGTIRVELIDPARLPLETHADTLDALRNAYATRELAPTQPTRDPAVTQPPETHRPPAVWNLTRSKMKAQAPDDGYVWVRSTPTPTRSFDAIIKRVPAFPDVQVALQRFPLDEFRTCERLKRYMTKVRRWRVREPLPGTPQGFDGDLAKRFGPWTTRHLCKRIGDALLDIRLSSAPAPTTLEPYAELLRRLETAAQTTPEAAETWAPSRHRYVTDRFLLRSLGTSVAISNRASSPGDSWRMAGPGLDASLLWAVRNGPMLRTRLTAAVDFATAFDGGPAAEGRFGGTHLEFAIDGWINIGFDTRTIIALGVGFQAVNGPLVEGSSLTGGVMFMQDLYYQDRFGWSLRLSPLSLFAEHGQWAFAPLSIEWQGVWPAQGLTAGVEFQYVGAPTLTTGPGLAQEGAALILRFGFGAKVH